MEWHIADYARLLNSNLYIFGKDLNIFGNRKDLDVVCIEMRPVLPFDDEM